MEVLPFSADGAYARIEPLSPVHAPGLFAIGADASIWAFLSLSAFESVDDARRYVATALDEAGRGVALPFAVIDRATGAVAGTTRYLDIRSHDRGLEIGWTWYGVAYQRTAINTETKLLLLQHAFETLGAERVQFKTDARNLRSQRAIERLGARREGVLRSHMILEKDGFVRDSVYYSIIRPEWEGVRERLESMLRAR